MCCAGAGKGIVFVTFSILKFRRMKSKIIAKINDDDDVVIITKVLRKV